MTSRTSLELVVEFHELFEQPIYSEPHLADEKVNQLRLDLIQEELNELRIGMDDRDPVAVLDALTDLQYVLDGTYLSLGLYPWKDAALAEVHASNLSKLGEDGKPIKYPNGKVFKGPNYFEPDLERILGEEK